MSAAPPSPRCPLLVLIQSPSFLPSAPIPTFLNIPSTPHSCLFDDGIGDLRSNVRSLLPCVVFIPSIQSACPHANDVCILANQSCQNGAHLSRSSAQLTPSLNSGSFQWYLSNTTHVQGWLKVIFMFQLATNRVIGYRTWNFSDALPMVWMLCSRNSKSARCHIWRQWAYKLAHYSPRKCKFASWWLKRVISLTV